MNFKSRPDPPRTLSVTYKEYVARVKSQPKVSIQPMKCHRQHPSNDDSSGGEDGTPQKLERKKDNWTRRERKREYHGRQTKNARGPG